MTVDDLHFEKLDAKHSVLLETFTCQEDDEFLKSLGLNSDKRRKAKLHNQEMDDFLKNEALVEQNLSLNTTHLLISGDSRLVGFISLCNDCIPLETEEKDDYGFTYTTIPALKIARFAIATEFQRQKLSTIFLNYATYIALTIREYSGFPFITLDCYKHRESFYKSKYEFIANSIQHDYTGFDNPISMRILVNDYLDKLKINDLMIFKE